MVHWTKCCAQCRRRKPVKGQTLCKLCKPARYAQIAKWRAKNKAKTCQYSRNWALANKAKLARAVREHVARLRAKVFKKLGNKCVKCGFTDKRALQIDHIFGGGYKENRGHSVSTNLKRVLRYGKKRYQILCANCNWIKRHERKEFGRGVKGGYYRRTPI